MTTILLVEDAYDLAQVIIRELEASGYSILHASDGLTALQLHAKEQPALVILDWLLPKLDGLEVLRRLRQAAPTPVLMLTARGEEADRVVGLELGADDYLTKLDSQPLDLSPTEFSLLHLLLRSPGRAFSRAYLLDTVWGETYIGGDRSVDNTVLRLRKKLGPLGEAIETVWGIGYRLRPKR